VNFVKSKFLTKTNTDLAGLSQFFAQGVQTVDPHFLGALGIELTPQTELTVRLNSLFTPLLDSGN
jgi:hypothetical protein